VHQHAGVGVGDLLGQLEGRAQAHADDRGPPGARRQLADQGAVLLLEPLLEAGGLPAAIARS
jgi:hypothetical protein